MSMKRSRNVWGFVLGLVFLSLLPFQNNGVSFFVGFFFFSFIDAFNIFLKAKRQNIVFDDETYNTLIHFLLSKYNSVEAMQVKDL